VSTTIFIQKKKDSLKSDYLSFPPGRINAKDNDYIKIFWVGLMDGDGSIQVNHWRKLSLQYRLVIKLNNLTSNYKMLVKIAQEIGGCVKVTRKDKDIIWVVNNKETIKKIIKIFDIYPPLTSKKKCQLNFLKECMLRNSVDWYLSHRNDKYLNQQFIINSCILDIEKGTFTISNYFRGWFSGFTEAEGCFSIRKNNNHSFSIGQNDDIYLINIIKTFLNSTNLIRNPRQVNQARGKFYFLEIYKKETLKTLINHFKDYPLLGEKANSFHKWELNLFK
jgi:LAGLIDADG endonuclease